MFDCKINKMHELKIIKFKIDCIFGKKQDCRHFINCDHITFPL